MVFQKRLENGFTGYSAPTMPQVPRSAKGKRSARRKVEDNQMYAFDLLAAVAGKLLLERENSVCLSDINDLLKPTANGKVKQEPLEEDKINKDEGFDRGSCNEGTLDSTISSHRHENYISKEQSYTPRLPITVKPDVSYEDVESGKLHIKCSRGEFGHNLGTGPEKCSSERHSPGSVESCEGRVQDGIKISYQAERQVNGKRTAEGSAYIFLEDPMELDATPIALVTSDSSFEVPPYGNHGRRDSSFAKNRNVVELAVDRDDDENSSGCTRPSMMTPRASRLHRVGDRRIRKLLASKHWKASPALTKNEELSNTDVEMKPIFRGRKFSCTRQRTQRSSFKRRKALDRCSMSIFEESTIVASNSCAALRGANGASSSMTGQRQSYESVKFSIKSFRVPELLIEIPETATVGSLKRTVLEAVTTVLGVGLHVGVLLRGKKVRDDNKTLSQVGISHGDMLDSLGFMLEPNAQSDPPPLENPAEVHLLPCDAAQPIGRLPSVVAATDPGTSGASPEVPLTPVNIPESDHDSVQSPPEANSRALVPLPPMTVGALSVIPLRKSKRSELVQRRIRRPFSVAEVDALVQAVEKLGTGRWRDVKLRAFDNAKHRTYVDLKDKWKTLVHTAQISPQQRRGEPVPQELLDRVLAAHSYWSQQQAKLQAKLPIAGVCLLH